jgi:transcriptional regulator with XRE-family HTH domain
MDDDAGQKLKRAREGLNLRYRDVEEASIKIAEWHKDDEFVIALSRLSDIENKKVVPTIYRLYSLAVIYRLDFLELLDWYGVDVSALPADAAGLPIGRTHLLQFQASDYGTAQVPLSLDPGIDLRKTSYLSRMIQRWGRLPMALLNRLDLKNHRYGYIGTDDWYMYPVIQPGALVLIDESRRKIVNGGWATEFERPIYFLERREGYRCAYCTLLENRLMLLPHPASRCTEEVYSFPDEIEVIGQVTAVAMVLDAGRKRRARG